MEQKCAHCWIQTGASWDLSNWSILWTPMSSFPVELGITECTSDIFCSNAVDYAYCDNGICNCSTGFQDQGDRLTCEQKELDDRCDGDADCTTNMPNTQCTNGVCECAFGYIPDSQSTCESIQVGVRTCITDADCAIINMTVCDPYTNLCSCARGYSPAQNDTTCECDVFWGDTCAEVGNFIVMNLS